MGHEKIGFVKTLHLHCCEGIVGNEVNFPLFHGGELAFLAEGNQFKGAVQGSGQVVN
jgi:hypothetical protein